MPKIVARAVLVAAMGLGVWPAGAQTSGPVGVTVAPARVEQDLAGRDVSVQMFVINNETSPRRISMHVAGLGHDLDGTPAFLESAPAASALLLSEDRFSLAPGERRDVLLTGEIPRDARGLYAAVLTEFSSPTPQPGVVEVRSRVASIFLLRGPKPWDQTVRVVDVGLRPGENGAVDVFAAVRNVGNVHVRPSGRVRIYKGRTLLDTVALPGENVIPGFARRLVGRWTPPPGFDGRVRLEADLGPGARRTETAEIRRGRAVSRTAEISDLRARVDARGPLVTLTLTNTGSVAIEPTIDLSATRENAVGAQASLPQPRVWPGDSRRIAWRPELADGVYLVPAQARLGGTLLDQDVTGLRVGAPAGAGPSSGRSAVWIALAALFLVALLAVWVVVARRRRDEDRRRTPPPSPPAPVSAEAPPPRNAGRRPVAVHPRNDKR